RVGLTVYLVKCNLDIQRVSLVKLPDQLGRECLRDVVLQQVSSKPVCRAFIGQNITQTVIILFYFFAVIISCVGSTTDNTDKTAMVATGSQRSRFHIVPNENFPKTKESIEGFGNNFFVFDGRCTCSEKIDSLYFFGIIYQGVAFMKQLLDPGGIIMMRIDSHRFEACYNLPFLCQSPVGQS